VGINFNVRIRLPENKNSVLQTPLKPKGKLILFSIGKFAGI